MEAVEARRGGHKFSELLKQAGSDVVIDHYHHFSTTYHNIFLSLTSNMAILGCLSGLLTLLDYDHNY